MSTREDVDTGPCPGSCCAAFYLPFTIRELRQRAPTLQDGDQIANMVIPLTPKEGNERLERFGSDKGEPLTWANRGHHFTCRNWDEDTRLCTIYEDRPEMCRGYPYAKPCQHCGACFGEPYAKPPEPDAGSA